MPQTKLLLNVLTVRVNCYYAFVSVGVTTAPPPTVRCSSTTSTQNEIVTINCTTSNLEILSTECGIDGGSTQPCKDCVCNRSSSGIYHALLVHMFRIPGLVFYWVRIIRS